MALFVTSVSAVCLIVGLLSAGLVQADEAQAWSALREGRALLLMRHATAPGVGDPAGFTLGDCRTQRNLNEQGRAEGRRWGERLRSLGIERPQLLSSRWCRAQDTAQAMGLGPVEPLPPLDSFFENRTTANQQMDTLLVQINAMPAGVARVLVSHQVNITALTGIYPASGEGLIIALPLTRPAKVLARIDPP